MLLRPFLISKGQYTENRLHGLKNTLNFEGTDYMVLRTLLILKGQKE